MKNVTSTQKLGWAAIALSLIFSLPGCSKDEALEPEIQTSIASLKTSNHYFSGEAPRPCMVRTLVAGQKTPVGLVEVAEVSGDLLVSYKITQPDLYLLEIQTDAFRDLEQLKTEKKLSKGGAIPGKFAFKSAWTESEKVTRYTVLIPKEYVNKALMDETCLNIATHAELSNGESAWAGLTKQTSSGVSLDPAKQFPGSNWSVYFEFCTDECNEEIDLTYAWEDLRDDNNDGDYNDLVVQSEIIKSAREVKITFLSTASGTVFDHEFKIRIPKKGITGIYEPEAKDIRVVSDGDDYIITIYQSVREAIPEMANTGSTTPCSPFGYKEIVLTIDDSFTYDPAKPYSPFISVYRSRHAGIGQSYDLSIYELTGKDCWKCPDGNTYPNGILIPKDWKWPLERVNIKQAYPDFPQKDWAKKIADEKLTFDKNRCK